MDNIKTAWHQGKQAAEAMRKGVKFIGAANAANSNGYTFGSEELKIFVSAYLLVLHDKFPNGLRTNRDGIITTNHYQ